MITRFAAWLRQLVQLLATHADNLTPSLRKVLVLGIGTLGLAMGVTFIGLSIASFVRTGSFDPSGFGTGAVQLLGGLVTLPLSLAKSMQWRPPEGEADPVEDPQP